MNEYRVEIKVKNNLIYDKVIQQGYPSINAFCMATKVGYAKLIDLINMKDSPLDSRGKFRPAVLKLCDVLRCTPDELFTQNQLDVELETNKFTYELKEAEMKFLVSNAVEPKLIEDIVHGDRTEQAINECLETLTPREQKILNLRFGLNGNEEMTLREVGKIFGITPERVRGIESKALRKLRHPSRSEMIKDFLPGEYDERG